MKITVLLENNKHPDAVCFNELKSAHGLSMYIETDTSKFLFDVGPDDSLISNAEIMGIDLSEVEAVFISHGHWDHGGGLEAFLKVNNSARIYLQKYALDNLYSLRTGKSPAYIGLDSTLLEKHRDRIIPVDKDLEISPGIKIYENFKGDFPLSVINENLRREESGIMVHDDFRHELILSLEDRGKRCLFTGCAHSGIVNMIKSILPDRGKPEISAVFGGFHLHSGGQNLNVSSAYLKALMEELKSFHMDFYTGHCTGDQNFNVLKKELGTRLKALNTGLSIEI